MTRDHLDAGVEATSKLWTRRLIDGDGVSGKIDSESDNNEATAAVHRRYRRLVLPLVCWGEERCLQEMAEYFSCKEAYISWAYKG